MKSRVFHLAEAVSRRRFNALGNAVAASARWRQFPDPDATDLRRHLVLQIRKL